MSSVHATTGDPIRFCSMDLGMPPAQMAVTSASSVFAGHVPLRHPMGCLMPLRAVGLECRQPSAGGEMR